MLTPEFIWGTSITLIGNKLVLIIITIIVWLIKATYTKENNYSTLEKTNRIYWELNWTFLKGRWTLAEVYARMLCAWYARKTKWMHEYSSLCIWWVSSPDSPTPWSWTILTPWRLFANPWLLLYYLEGSMLILVSRRITTSDLLRLRWSLRSLTSCESDALL